MRVFGLQHVRVRRDLPFRTGHHRRRWQLNTLLTLPGGAEGSWTGFTPRTDRCYWRGLLGFRRFRVRGLPPSVSYCIGWGGDALALAARVHYPFLFVHVHLGPPGITWGYFEVGPRHERTRWPIAFSAINQRVCAVRPEVSGSVTSIRYVARHRSAHPRP